MDLREIGWGDMNWICLVQDKDWWQTLLNTIMNIRVPKTLENSGVVGQLVACQGLGSMYIVS
jgi:hypothetical protein